MLMIVSRHLNELCFARFLHVHIDIFCAHHQEIRTHHSVRINQSVELVIKTRDER